MPPSLEGQYRAGGLQNSTETPHAETSKGGDEMKKCYVGAAAVLVVLSMTMYAAAASAAKPSEWNGNGDRPNDPGSYPLSQNVVYGEKVVKDGVNYGIYMDGSLVNLDVPYVNPTTGLSYDMSWEESISVTADWSDNLVLHEWDYGDKIRTEVILVVPGGELTSVFTITASFTIEYMVDGVWTEMWYGTTESGLWADGPVDAYSAEVNQVGVLLFGYNWDTRSFNDMGPGQYRLTFTLLDLSSTVPTYKEYVDETTYNEYAIEYGDVAISGTIDDVMYPDNYLDGIGSDADSTWIELTLY